MLLIVVLWVTLGDVQGLFLNLHSEVTPGRFEEPYRIPRTKSVLTTCSLVPYLLYYFSRLIVMIDVKEYCPRDWIYDVYSKIDKLYFQVNVEFIYYT